MTPEFVALFIFAVGTIGTLIWQRQNSQNVELRDIYEQLTEIRERLSRIEQQLKNAG